MAKDRANDPNRVFDAEELRKHMGMHHDEATVEKFQGKYYPEMQKAQEDTNAYLSARAAREAQE
jgi:uncharacterized protein YeaO (DUF488 family)